MEATFRFILSKVFWALAEPGGALVVLTAIGIALMWTRWMRFGRGLASLAMALLLVLSILPTGPWLLALLEDRFPPAEPQGPVAGIISLGGGINPGLTFAHGQPNLNGSAERLTVFAELARRYPEAQLVFAGGGAQVNVDPATSEAAAAKLFFAGQGMDVSRIKFETQSRNTHENAMHTVALLGDRAHRGQWLLVTTASHMARAVGVFRKAGMDVTAYPVDHWLPPQGKRAFSLGRAGNVGVLSTAIHEIAGLAAYRIMGLSDDWFPAADGNP